MVGEDDRLMKHVDTSITAFYNWIGGFGGGMLLRYLGI